MGGQISFVKLQSFYNFNCCVKRLIFFDGDYTFHRYLFHCIGNELAYLLISGRDGCDKCHIFFAFQFLAVLFEAIDRLFNRLVDSLF